MCLMPMPMKAMIPLVKSSLALDLLASPRARDSAPNVLPISG